MVSFRDLCKYFILNLKDILRDPDFSFLSLRADLTYIGKGKNKDVDAQDDHNILAEMGYSQELLRGVTGWFMNFAFTFTAVSIISSYSILFGTGLTTGGPSTLFPRKFTTHIIFSRDGLGLGHRIFLHDSRRTYHG